MWATKRNLDARSPFSVDGYGPPKRKPWPCAIGSLRESLAQQGATSLLWRRIPLGQKIKRKTTQKRRRPRPWNESRRRATEMSGLSRWTMGSTVHGIRSTDSMAGRSPVYGRYTSVDNEDQTEDGKGLLVPPVRTGAPLTHRSLVLGRYQHSLHLETRPS